MTPKNSNYCFIAGHTFYLRWYALNSEQGLKCAYLDHIITLHFTLHECTFILHYPCYLLVTLLLPLRCWIGASCSFGIHPSSSPPCQ